MTDEIDERSPESAAWLDWHRIRWNRFQCECGAAYRYRETRDHCRTMNHGEPDHDT